ncbi:MAG: IS1182 family transposase [Chloroflexi bacterium]|nr:IS1182 family transposase [Chloroflexota bacterium]
MRPVPWQPPVDLAPPEQAVARRVRRAKLFVFLRTHRHTLFDVAFQEELATLYADRAKGHPPVPPALLALVTILQAYTGASDAEAVEATVMDRRWQLVLDCLDCTDAPFSVGTLVAFRERLIARDLDRRLIERTVEVAAQTKGFGHTVLRAALDSSPLWGAGRVEDTYNLLGHALRKAVGVLARQQGRELADVAMAAGAPILAGTSLKAALDLDWDDPAARTEALGIVLAALGAIEAEVAAQPEGPARAEAQESVAVARQVQAQDVAERADGPATLRQGVAPDRRISVEDADMRHGRKSRTRLIDGYKRHVLRDLDQEMVRAVGLTRANAPEATVTDAIVADVAAQGATLGELHIDRAYLGSALVRDRSPELTIYCKAWPVRQGDHFAKTAFHLDWTRDVLTCPQGEEMPFVPGGIVHFPTTTCQTCPLHNQCTASPHGRSVSIHRDERLLQELRERQQTAAGRAALRERVPVEHALAHIGAWQGDRARYIGQRKNLLDLRRMAVVHNLHVLQRLPAVADLLRAA